MKRGMKILAILTVLAGVGMFHEAVMANCQNPDRVYPVEHCGTEAWFQSRSDAGIPPTATLSGAWWALGFGNANNTAAIVKKDGSGYFYYYDFVNPPIREFYGVDSGATDLTAEPFAYAANLRTTNGPTDALCFGAGANWTGVTMDGCADANRRGAGAQTIPSSYGIDLSDNFINKYFGTTPGNLFRHYQVDSPMGVLMKATDNGVVVKFALAFFASRDRNSDSTDIAPGLYDMGAITNGLPNGSGANNVVPWQDVPTPSISATIQNPADPNSDRILSLSWTPAQFIHDNSVRPCNPGATANPCLNNILGFKEDGVTPVPGVGVLDQGAIIRYIVESTAFAGGNCGTTWTAKQTVFHPGSSANNVVVPPDSCVRLRTAFGRVPSATFNPAGGNMAVAATGRLGDLGYDVTSASTVIGSALVSNGLKIDSVTAQRGDVTVRWSTFAELSVSGFEIVAVRRNGSEQVIAREDCSACSSGLGSSYQRVLSAGDIRGAQSLYVRMLPSGSTSETVEIPIGRSR